MELPDANAGRTVVRGERTTLEGLKKVLESIADDSRIPPKFAEWIRVTLRCGGRMIRILGVHPGAQFKKSKTSAARR